MKKTTLSLAALVTLSSAVFANPVNQNTTDYMETAGYIGIGYTRISGTVDFSLLGVGNEDFDTSSNAVTLNAGVSFNPYIAAEVRYTKSIDETNIDTGFGTVYSEDKISNFGAYIKPQYKTGTGTIYGLLGYGKVDFDTGSENEFQWGIGASYEFESKVSVYFDYMRILDSAETVFIGSDTLSVDESLSTYTFGISYRF